MKFKCIEDNREIIVTDKATIERYKGYPDKFEIIEEASNKKAEKPIIKETETPKENKKNK